VDWGPRDHITAKPTRRDVMDTIDRNDTSAKPEAKPARKEKVLRAKPVNGEVDWAELSREHIARYPKIRARLAE
jgi:hypothetical protein